MMLDPLFAFQEYTIAEKEIKMLELETLLMLVNGVERVWPQILFIQVWSEYGPKKWQSPFKSIFEKIFNI